MKFQFIYGILPALLLLAACQKDQYIELAVSFNSQAESSQLDSLKQALIRQDGILTVAIEPEQGGVIICYDRFQTADKRILQIIHEVGMKENILEKRPWKQRD